MLTTLDRYILRHLLVGLAVGAAGLLVLIWLINSLKFLDWLINKGLALATFLKVTLLLMPGFLTVFMPLALFAVVVFVYTRLESDREVMVARAAGMSALRLARPVLVLCAGLTLFGYWLTLVVVPDLEWAFDDIKVRVRQDLSNVVIKEGRFNEIDDRLVVYVGHREQDGTLHDILVHDTTNLGKQVTVVANSGTLVSAEEGIRVLLMNGSRQERTRESGKVSLLYFDSYAISLGDDGGGLSLRYRDERQRPFRELVGIQVGDRIHPDLPYVYEDRHVRRLRMELHLRLLRPMGHLAFVVLALAAVLTGPYNRQGSQTPRVVFAVALVVLFQAGHLGAASAAKKTYDALILLDLMTIVPLALGLAWLFWPQDRWPLGRRIQPPATPMPLGSSTTREVRA